MHVLYNNKQVMLLDQYKKYTSNKTQVRLEKNNKTSSHYRIIRELFKYSLTMDENENFYRVSLVN